MCCCYDAPQPDFHSDRIVKARKPHECCECLRDIQPGERYEYVSGKWDGELSVYKTCLPCVELRTKLSATCGCWVYGGIVDELSNSYEHDLTLGERAWLLSREILYKLRKEQRERHAS